MRRASYWLALALLSTACSSEVLGPACTLMQVERSVVFGDPGPEACTFREDALPGPWLDLEGCEIRVLLPLGSTCDDVGGRELEGEEGRARCELDRLAVADRTPGAPVPTGSGWFWDDFTTDMPCPLEPSPNTFRIVPTLPAETRIELACLTSVPAASGANARCDAAEPCDGGLVCDPIRGRCTAACASDADCFAASLDGWICDARPRNEIDRRLLDTSPHLFCINPTCEVD